MFRSLSVLLCIWGGELAGSCCFEFLWELDVEARPRQGSVLACVYSCWNKRGTSESKSSSANTL